MSFDDSARAQPQKPPNNAENDQTRKTKSPKICNDRYDVRSTGNVLHVQRSTHTDMLHHNNQ